MQVIAKRHPIFMSSGRIIQPNSGSIPSDCGKVARCGEGIHWPNLDEDINVENLLAGKPSGESQRSLKRWIEDRAPGGKQSQ
jgi:hypothetical protein